MSTVVNTVRIQVNHEKGGMQKNRELSCVFFTRTYETDQCTIYIARTYLGIVFNEKGGIQRLFYLKAGWWYFFVHANVLLKNYSLRVGQLDFSKVNGARENARFNWLTLTVTSAFFGYGRCVVGYRSFKRDF